MAISLSKIINSWVPENSKVIDFGCGDGNYLNSIKLKWNLIVEEFKKLTTNLKFN